MTLKIKDNVKHFEETFTTEGINFNLKCPAAYLETCQTSVMEPFGKISSRVLPVNYFPPNTPSYMSVKVLNMSLVSKI